MLIGMWKNRKSFIGWCKTMETVKRSVFARVQGSGEINRQSTDDL